MTEGQLDHEANRILGELIHRGRLAKEEGFAIEAIAIRLYILETWLRRFLRRWASDPDPRTQFAALIELARDSGLDRALVSRLKHFNKYRRAAIHQLLWGEIRYDELEQAVFGEDPRLPADIENWMAISADLPRPQVSG